MFYPRITNKPRLGIWILLLALLLSAAPLAAQQDFFVSPFGSDSTGDGSSSAPFRTVTQANGVAATPGDRVLIAPGTYGPTDGEIFPLLVGDGVSLIGPSIGSATLDGSGVLVPILVIGTSATAVRIEHLRILGEGVVIQVFGNPADLQVADCAFLGGRRAIDRDFAGDSSSLTVERCSFLDMEEYGILWKVTASAPGDLLVSVRDCVFTGKNFSVSGIEVGGLGGTAFTVDIQRNSVEGFGSGLRLTINGTSSDASFTGLVANNSFRKEDGSGIEVRLDTLGPGVAKATMDVTFLYNLLEKNGDFGADFRSTANGADSTCILSSVFQGNTIQFNKKSGLLFRETTFLGGSSFMLPDLGGGAGGSAGGNTFSSNDNLYQSGAEFDLRVESNEDISAQGNWWFVLSSIQVVQQGLEFLTAEMDLHILDGHDNPLNGLVDQTNFLFGDLIFTPSPKKVIADGNSPMSLVVKEGSFFVPGAGTLPSQLDVNGIPVLLFTVSPSGLLLDFTVPSISLIGGGTAIATLTLPAGQTGSSPLTLIRTNNKGRLECFVATAAFGSPLTEELDTLRTWRDDVLLPNPIGMWMVGKYYQYSPPLATWIGKSPRRRAAARLLIQPILRWVKMEQGQRPWVLACPFTK